jgi:uncharacterized protein (DUF362 family)/Pyruvate/2-oxoacid:ferredoxin oxidoreductase delta subunit
MSKVSIVKCKDYNSKKVIDSVFRAVGLLGGIETFAKQGDNVLIKPNLLSARVPEEAVTTHPELVRAAIRLVKGVGATPLVGDSPGTFFTIKDVNHVYEKTGIKRIAEEEGVELVRFDKSRIINDYPIAEVALNVSSIISLPKLKTHALTVMTGAIKNTFGLVPGHFKVECHRNKPKPKNFVKVILDVFQITKPRLSIMDGVLAMEGDGPGAGNPKEVGLILASPDAVSLDAVISKLVGLPSFKDLIINEARQRGAGEADINNIEILGEAIEDIKIKDFKLPMTAHGINLLPDFLTDIFTQAVIFKPIIDERLCKKCGVCKRSCPVDAITINEATSHIDNKICIRCFCCHEACPYKAIFIKRNFFANLLWREEKVGNRE